MKTENENILAALVRLQSERWPERQCEILLADYFARHQTVCAAFLEQIRNEKLSLGFSDLHSIFNAIDDQNRLLLGTYERCRHSAFLHREEEAK